MCHLIKPLACLVSYQNSLDRLEIERIFFAYSKGFCHDFFAAVCSKADEDECHQIDHCQLVIGGVRECICQDRSSCQDEFGEPVCGSDHVTYRNACQLKNAACAKHLNLTQIADVPCGK